MKIRKIFALALAAGMTLSFAACGNSESESPASESTDASDSAAQNGESSDNSNGGNSSGEGEATRAEEPTYTASQLNDYSYADGVESTEYVIGNGITDRMVALSELNVGNRVRLAEAMKKAEDGGEITVAYIGGSITQGSSAGDDGCYARLVTNWFISTFPNAKINYNRAGIGATGSYIGVHRVDSDVLSTDPDIVFVEFSVNDTTENINRNVESYDSLLRKIWNSESAPAIVCIGMTQQNGTSFQNYHYDIAKHYDLPFISYRNAILDVINEGYIEWTDISDDTIHPNTVGHKVLTEIITHYLEKTNEEKDTITGEESDFSEAYTSDIYANATLLTPSNCDVDNDTLKAYPDKNFSNFTGYWLARVNDEGFKGAKLVFENVEAQNIGLLYGKTTTKSCKIDVYIDGTLYKTIDTDFTNGWGNYTECEAIVSFAEKGTHTVEIIPQDTGASAVCYITALAIS